MSKAHNGRQTLAERVVAARSKSYVLDLAALGEDSGVPIASLHELCYEKNPTVAFRAAWILEYLAARDHQRFLKVFDDFMDRLHQQRNPSCQRHFTKILMNITHPKAPPAYQEAYRQTDRERLVETVFGWLIDPATPVAVQVNCMDILFNMRREFPWITDELKQQIRFFLRDGSPAMQSRGKRILENLNRSEPKVDPHG